MADSASDNSKQVILPGTVTDLMTAFRQGIGLLRDLGGNPLPQANAYAMIQRRAKSGGITTRVGNHTFRATGVTAFLKNGGTLERAAQMANHASTRTTQLYDRRAEEVTLDERGANSCLKVNNERGDKCVLPCQR
jgi:integrase